MKDNEGTSDKAGLNDEEARDFFEYGWYTFADGSTIEGLALYDVWFAKVKADAWDEGKNYGLMHEGFIFVNAADPNPYRVLVAGEETT
jgi:hypothetical protein